MTTIVASDSHIAHSIVIPCTVAEHAKGFLRTYLGCVSPIAWVPAISLDTSEVVSITIVVASILDANHADCHHHLFSEFTEQTASFADQAQPQRFAATEEIPDPDHVSTLAVAVIAVEDSCFVRDSDSERKNGHPFSNDLGRSFKCKTICRSSQ